MRIYHIIYIMIYHENLTFFFRFEHKMEVSFLLFLPFLVGTSSEPLSLTAVRRFLERAVRTEVIF